MTVDAMAPPSTTRALWFRRALDAALVDEALAIPPDGFSVVRATCSAVSPGTERLVFAGEVPAALREEMRVPYMGGDFGFPLKYGYSVVGHVESSANAALRGRLVHLMHPHQDRVVVRDEDLFVVPDGIPAARATLAANLETAVNAVWDSQVSIGAACVVIGFGIVGSLVARLVARMPGSRVVVCDSHPAKVALASRLGFAACAPEDLDGAFDVAFHASATSQGLQRCIDAVGLEGTIVEASWYGTRGVELNLGGTFHNQRKRIVATQVSTIPAPLRSRWSHRRRKELVFELLRDGAFDAHVTETVAFTDLARWFNEGGLERPGLARVVDYRSGAA
jgi:threonine dehydrogenase-like Zn-dependent dehydrogenase